MTGKRAREGGFSLIELLIVLSILGLLVSIVAPAGFRLPALVRSVKCKTHLRAIAEAYNAHKVNEHWDDKVAGQFSAITWRADLRPHMNGSTTAFSCPEDDNPDFSLPVSSITIYDGDTQLYEVQLFDTHPYWLEGDHNSFMPDKPGMWRVNDDVYNGGDLDRFNMPMYTEGSDPSVSWWLIEDYRYGDQFQYATYDSDFNDLSIKMTDLGGGVYEVEGAETNARFNFGIRGPDGVEVREDGGAIGPLVMESAMGSYGINWAVSKLYHGTDRILAMDYDDPVIYAGSDINPANDNWTEKAVVRHLGKLNGVMTSGAVFSARLDEVDPHNPTLNNKLWNPQGR